MWQFDRAHVVKFSRSGSNEMSSLSSGEILSLSRSSSWSEVIWQYSAVLSTMHAVRTSCRFARPSTERRVKSGLSR